MTSTFDFEREKERQGERLVKCPSCGQFSKIRNFHEFGHGQWVMCPRCRRSFPREKFNKLQDGILAYSQKPAKPPCKCRQCELDCAVYRGTDQCVLERE